MLFTFKNFVHQLILLFRFSIQCDLVKEVGKHAPAASLTLGPLAFVQGSVLATITHAINNRFMAKFFIQTQVITCTVRGSLHAMSGQLFTVFMLSQNIDASTDLPCIQSHQNKIKFTREWFNPLSGWFNVTSNCIIKPKAL